LIQSYFSNQIIPEDEIEYNCCESVLMLIYKAGGKTDRQPKPYYGAMFEKLLKKESPVWDQFINVYPSQPQSCPAPVLKVIKEGMVGGCGQN
jgi:hypothetical protein